MQVATFVATAVLAVITLAYVLITRGLLLEARADRERLLARDESEQARLVGGYIAWITDHGGLAMLGLRVVNTSPLPIRAAKGVLVDPATGAQVMDFPEISVIPENSADEAELHVASNIARMALHLRLDFDDDNGQGWRKYESAEVPLRKLTLAERAPAPAPGHPMGESL